MLQENILRCNKTYILGDKLFLVLLSKNLNTNPLYRADNKSYLYCNCKLIKISLPK